MHIDSKTIWPTWITITVISGIVLHHGLGSLQYVLRLTIGENQVWTDQLWTHILREMYQ